MYDILVYLFADNTLNLANYVMLLFFGIYLFRSRLMIFKVRTPVFWSVVAASVTYLMFYIKNYGMPGQSSLLVRFITPVVMLVLGYAMTKRDLSSLKRDTIIMSFASCIHGVLNVVINRNVDILTVDGRQYRDIYGGVVSGTLQNLFFLISSALLFYFMFCVSNKKLRVAGTLAGMAGTFGSIINASRTMILMTGIAFVFSLFLFLYLRFGFGSAVLKSVLSGLLVLIAVLVILWLDLFGVQEIFLNSALGRRQSTAASTASITNNLRWMYAGDVLKLLPSYPWGGMRYNHYAHNLWLDVAKEGGVIPFVLYIIVAVQSLWVGIRFYKDERNSIEDKVFFVSVVMTFLLVFFTEPIMTGAALTFAQFMFIIGGLSAYNRRKEYDLQEA